MYSSEPGCSLSLDPLDFDSGDDNLDRNAFNNPTTLTDPTGEFTFSPWLLKASAEAAVNTLIRAIRDRCFDRSVTPAAEAFKESICDR